MKISRSAMARVAVTAVAVVAAAFAAQRLWQHYELDPWTRDGRVRASVVQIAPDVAGLVSDVQVRDNQLVHPGQVLFQIDRVRYELALRQAEAAERSQRATLAQAQREARRNADLAQLISQEAVEQGQSRVDLALAALAQAQVALDTARLNLARTAVVATVNGSVTNLDLQRGAYVTAGKPVMALIDRDSLYVEGYFEETKLARIHPGAAARVRIMGRTDTLTGHVESVAQGIADRDRSVASNLLPNVNPTFNWVRLAQRVPVRIVLDPLPAGAQLVTGQTATVAVDEDRLAAPGAVAGPATASAVLLPPRAERPARRGV